MAVTARSLKLKTVSLAPGECLSPDALGRRGSLPPEALEAAATIVAQVREKKDAALRDYAQRFDGFCPERFLVDEALLDEACERVDSRLLAAIEQAAKQIKAFHEKERLSSWTLSREDGTTLGVAVRPLAAAGIYVPGGRARYPSTVLMNALPAKVAGVERLVMVTPPQADGTLSAATLCAARVAGVDEVYAVGGAQAVAALAYGTESIAPVDKICGPGNAYVAAAKRIVSGDVGVDMVAGPSEVCVLQDASVDADPLVIAADLAAQAEHDPLAACCLVVFAGNAPSNTSSGREAAHSADDAVRALAAAVTQELERILAQSPRAEVTRASLQDHGLIVLAASEQDAVAAVNAIAPEHLEVHTAHPWQTLESIRAAGAIFLGPWSSEPLGDYVPGPNHTLPTGGTARFAGPLSTSDFQTCSSVIAYTREGVLADAPATCTLSQAEGLWSHGLSAGLRAEKAQNKVVGEDAPLGPIAWPVSLGAEATVTLARSVAQ